MREELLSCTSWPPEYLFPEALKNEIYAKGARQDLGEPLLPPALSSLPKYLPWWVRSQGHQL